MQPHPRRSVDRMLAAAAAGVGLSEVLVVVALAGLLAPAGGVYLRRVGAPTGVSVVLVHPTGLIQSFRWSDGGWR